MTETANFEDTISKLQAQRGICTFPALDHAEARKIGAAVARLAEAAEHPVAIAVFLGEQRVFHVAFAGTTAEHDDWLRRKRNTVLRHDAPSLEVALQYRVSGRNPDWLDPREFAVAGGALPLRVGDNLVGVVAVSGLTNSMSADHDLVIEALASLER
ncbi:heme-binding protein [Microbacterium sp. PRC9]|uniref:heme-binding protein n=1 Tax=Microbacterium sp. PRC9 TaxID=2962591 RepID=UPI002880C1AB|nr:heme-binding protein [Microbacterium sp. PRC9]MDT0144548.1 heme-binding protein [Microbacterium sp. PRC9]